jgi:hypothetical protein
MVSLVDSGMIERKATEAALDHPPAIMAEAAPPKQSPFVMPNEKKDPANSPLNFRVTSAFRREFRMYAADHGLRLNEVLVEAFRALQKMK